MRHGNQIRRVKGKTMPPKKNPLKLNKLQLKTLTLLQELAKDGAPQNDGSILISGFPAPHGDHFHIGGGIAYKSDATGLQNEVVFRALEKKGMIVSQFPMAALITSDGLAYDTHIRDQIIFDSDADD